MGLALPFPYYSIPCLSKILSLLRIQVKRHRVLQHQSAHHSNSERPAIYFGLLLLFVNLCLCDPMKIVSAFTSISNAGMWDSNRLQAI